MERQGSPVVCLYFYQASSKNTIGTSTVPKNKQVNDSGLPLVTSQLTVGQHDPPGKVAGTSQAPPKKQHSHPVPAPKSNGQMKPKSSPLQCVTRLKGGYVEKTTTVAADCTGSEYQQHLAEVEVEVLNESGESFVQSAEVG